MYVHTYVHTTDSCTPFFHWTELTGELSHGVPTSIEDLISFATLLFTAEREHNNMVLSMIKVTTNSGNDKQWPMRKYTKFNDKGTVMPNSDPPKLGPMVPNLVAVLGPMGPNST